MSVFERVKASIIDQNFDFVDVLSMVSQFSLQHPEVSNALCRHTQDILTSAPADSDGMVDLVLSEVVAEAYRRTFFDEGEAAKYGTEHIAANSAAMEQFADLLVSRLEMATAVGAALTVANIMPASPHAH